MFVIDHIYAKIPELGLKYWELAFTKKSAMNNKSSVLSLPYNLNIIDTDVCIYNWSINLALDFPGEFVEGSDTW